MKCCSVIAILCSFFLVPSKIIAQDTPLPFRTAIELALKNSATSGLARADAQRARASYLQARDLFLPQMTLGSGLAFSYGFPLSIEGSAPSIIDLNTQQFLFNAAQREFMKAARSDIHATGAQNADRRNDVIMETAWTTSSLIFLNPAQASRASNNRWRKSLRML